MNHTPKMSDRLSFAALAAAALLGAEVCAACLPGLCATIPSPVVSVRSAGSRSTLLVSSLESIADAVSSAQATTGRPTSPAPQQGAPPANTPPGRTQPPTPSTDIISPLFLQAQDALDRNDYDAAIALLQKIITERPTEPLPHFELGYAYSELKRNGEAVAEYRRALALDPTMVAAHLNLGVTLLPSDPAAALESFHRAAALAPHDARPHFLAGQALERTNKLPEAIAEYMAGLAIAPRDQPLKFALGKTLLAAGRAAEAESQFRGAIALDPSLTVDSASAENSAAGDAGNGQPPPAPSAPGNFTTPAKLGLAETLLRENKNAEAADAFAAYLVAAPRNSTAHFERSVALQNAGRLDEALAELDRADQVAAQPAAQAGGQAAGQAAGPATGQVTGRADGQAEPKGAPADSLKLRASIYMQQKNWAAAGAALQKALAASPDDAELHAWQGHTQVELHNYAAAENELQRSLSLNPQPADVLGDLVNAYYLSGNYSQALQTLDLLATRQELTAINWFFRAICCDKLRELKEAAASYQKFLDLDHGSHPDQEFQARQRIKILQRELKR